MESLFFHPKLVHLPIALGVLMPLVSAGLLLAWWRELLPRRAWIVAILLQAILVASGVAAMQSGEAEEERVEAVVPESAIEAHEEAAEAFVYGAAAALVIMLGAYFVPAEKARLPLGAVSVLATLVVLALGYRTGEAGGRLVYELGAAQAYVGASAGTAPSETGEGLAAPAAERSAWGEHDEDDDDD